jgi:hypothetical protein
MSLSGFIINIGRISETMTTKNGKLIERFMFTMTWDILGLLLTKMAIEAAIKTVAIQADGFLRIRNVRTI